MTALACLRILVDPGSVAHVGDDLASMVGRVAGAYLESRWRWPRRYGEIAPYAFLLADPRATRLDAAELVALSRELQLKLFGDGGGGGGVSLATLEGEQDAVTRFAAVEPDALRRIIAEGGTIEGLAGCISQITSAGVRVVSPPDEAGPLQPVTVSEAAPRRAAPVADDSVSVSFRGVWCAPKDSFIGNALLAGRKGAWTFHSTVDGPADLPGAASTDFDLDCLKAAPAALIGSHGLLFLPISYSSAVQGQTRERYVDALEALPQACRPRLAAAVYDVPRGPSFGAVGQIKSFLQPYFSFIDLQISDPDFQIDALMTGVVTSVTLSLPDTDEGGRLAAAKRFMANREAYKKHHTWPAITNLRTRRELAACLKLRVPFLSGKAVCDSLSIPAVPARFAPDRMPLRDPGLANDHPEALAAS